MSEDRARFDSFRVIAWVATLGFLAIATIAALLVRDLVAERISGHLVNDIYPADVAPCPDFVYRERAKVRVARKIR